MSHAALLRKPKGAVPRSEGVSRTLRINQTNDSLEHEADRAAGEVLAGAARSMRLRMGETDDSFEQEAPPIVYEALRSPGRPLDPLTRAFFENRFGHDFSRVRIHTDARAAESAKAVGALAYTLRDDVVFAAGRYAPQEPGGGRLLAHELAHTVQHSRNPNAAAVQRKPDEVHPALVKTRAAGTELIEDAYGAGSLDEKQWRNLVIAAKQKRGSDDDGAVRDYLTLYRDAAKIAGAPGGSINLTQGASDHVMPGLNFALSGLEAEASTAFVNGEGKFGVRLTFTLDDLKLGVAIILGPLAFDERKEHTLAVLRHEMMHVEHHEMALDAVRRFLTRPKARAGKRLGSPEEQFSNWLSDESMRGLSKVDAALIRGANVSHEPNTELLAHVEGFMTHFHLTHPAPADEKDPAFQELWGALDTGSGNPWKDATKEVRSEALGRLQEYYCHSLDRKHREAFEGWVRYQHRKWKNYNFSVVGRDRMRPGDPDLDIQTPENAPDAYGMKKRTMEASDMPAFLHGLLDIIEGKCKGLGGLEPPLAAAASKR
jgi:hypothetical protein